MKIKLSRSQWEEMGKKAGWMKVQQYDPSKIEPSEKQLDLCYMILKEIGSCEADEDGQPIFELSQKNADEFIKKHQYVFRRRYNGRSDDRDPDMSAGDWGGIPNH